MLFICTTVIAMSPIKVKAEFFNLVNFPCKLIGG